MKLFEAQLQNLKQQLEAAPWLKWAGLLIAVLIALLALNALDQWRVTRQKNSIEAEQNLRKILALKGQDVWLAREKSALALLDSLNAQLPQVATPGMAQASLQNWLRSITSNYASQQNVAIRINRSAPLEAAPDILQVNAALNGNFDPGQALALLRKIESSPNLVTIETLNIQSDSSNTLHLTLNAYYRIRSGATAP